MSTINIDTLKYAKTLIDAGVTKETAEAQAIALNEAIAESIEPRVVTKGDIQALRAELKADTKITHSYMLLLGALSILPAFKALGLW